ncbi:hypothetical protein [Rheinheimera sp. MM224]|uniref:hypothetical protein n=1 Tax=Rheinheimera sp. MM224 TaxID=3019969 RepID=UPI0021F91B41|nr:hypothetical protein [Rheinheimera sp. MM224]CAI3799120.1 hypothetical protein JAMGFMIE_02248 [Rheinheimera sp. MM224]
MAENYSYSLIETFKAKKGITKNRDVVDLIEGMNEGNLSNIKSGNRHLTPEQGLFIAEQCGLDIGEVLVKLDIERSKNPAVQEALTQFLKRIATAVAVVSLTLGLMMAPQNHDAAASV